jgi:hypothetical protein
MAKQVTRRASFVIVFGEGDERWSFPDPGHDIVQQAQHRVRYGQPLEQCNTDALVLGDTVSALAYLLYDCPTTKLAQEKLAAMRRAIRELPPNTDQASERK